MEIKLLKLMNKIMDYEDLGKKTQESFKKVTKSSQKVAEKQNELFKMLLDDEPEDE